MVDTSSIPRLYKPSTSSGWAFVGLVLFLLAVMVIKYGVEDILSPGGLSVLGFGLVFTAYLDFFGLRRWVHLYDDRLEIQTALAKLLHDRWRLTWARPIVIYYAQIQTLRRARGFGGYNFLALLLRDRRPGQRAGYLIPYHGVENSADLEAELLRRVPPTCELYSVNFLGHRGPFR